MVEFAQPLLAIRKMANREHLKNTLIWKKLHLELIRPRYSPQGKYKGFYIPYIPYIPVPSRNPKYWRRSGRINQAFCECHELC